MPSHGLTTPAQIYRNFIKRTWAPFPFAENTGFISSAILTQVRLAARYATRLRALYVIGPESFGSMHHHPIDESSQNRTGRNPVRVGPSVGERKGEWAADDGLISWRCFSEVGGIATND